MDHTRIDPLHAEIATLRKRIDFLEAELQALNEDVGMQADRIRARFKTTPVQSRILTLLAGGGVFTRYHIIERCDLVTDRDRTIDVHVMRLRKKIAPLEIKTHWGNGLSLEGESLAAIRAIIKGEAA